MLDHIPCELQVEIIKRVPVKSLLKFRCVSKEWKSLIDNPTFSDDYCALQSQPHRLLISYIPCRSSICSEKFVSVADDHTLHQHQIPAAALPRSVNNGMVSQTVGCSHGIFAFFGADYRDGSKMVVLWNPRIRKSVDVPIPNVLSDPYKTILGFGVSPHTKDPKIVKVYNCYSSISDTLVPIPWRVEVFTLSSGTWKSLSCGINILPFRDSIRFRWGQVALDGVIYWHAFEWNEVDGRILDHNLIMSFDLSSEGFEEVCLPDNLACLRIDNLTISKRMESVVVLERDKTETFCGVWMMGQGVTKSFTKLFTLVSRVSPFRLMICGFMKNGEPIVDHESNALFAYDTYSEPIKDLGIVGSGFDVKSYKETLLLIDQ